MQNNLDGLEIISIGSLYKGAWDKKYWSSSRGKDRYPYTIGYHAVRTHNGITYKMEICEGIKGPSFQITSTDGESCSGQTPDIAWESFQRKSAPRTKIGHGKRFSCKIDGVEFFGFRNALVQRMLRELVSNVNGKAERNLLSANFSSKARKVEPDKPPSISCQPPDLLALIVKPQNTKKRTRKDKRATVYATSGPESECLRSQDVSGTNVSPLEMDKVAESGRNSFSNKGGSSLDANLLKEQKPNSLRDTNLLKEQKPILLDDSKVSAPVINSPKQEELIDMVLDIDTQQCVTSATTKDDIEETVTYSESKNVNNSELCVPDSLDLLHDNVSDVGPECKMPSPCKIENKLDVSGLVLSEEVEGNLHGKHEFCMHTSNGNSEKSSDDSPEQELANSMMTLLLPQALPLLKKSSGRKRAKVHSSEISGDAMNLAALKLSDENNGALRSTDILSSGTVTVGALEGSPKEVQRLDTTRHLDSQSLENVASVVPDSFEDEQFGHRSCQKTLSSDFVEADDGICGNKGCNPEKLIGNSSAEAGCSSIHVGIHAINATDGNDNLKKDGILRSDSHLICVPTDQQVQSNGNFEAFMGSDHSLLHPELCSRIENPVLSDQVKDVPTFDATSSMDSETQPFRVQRNLSLVDELPSKGARCGTDVDVLTSEVNVAEVHPLQHANNIGSSTQENKKIIQFRRRNPARGKKLQNSNNENNNDIASKQISCTKDLNPTLRESSHHMPDKEVVETRDTINSNISSSIQISGVQTTRIARAPFSESILFRNTRECSETATLLSTDISPVGTSVDSLHSKVSVEGEVKLDTKQKHLSGETGTIRPNNVFSASKNKKQPRADTIVDGDGSLQLCQEREKSLVSDDNSHGIMEHLVTSSVHPQLKSVTGSGQDSGNLSSRSELHKTRIRPSKFVSPDDANPSKTLEDFVDLIGCYMQPAPILSVVLSTQGENIHISVLCGILADRLRTIFVYKVPLKNPRRGNPSFLGHTLIVLPISKYTFSGEIAFERFPLQFTPDGETLVFSNSFKAPYCREQNINCLCSVCTTNCREENAIKIIRVKLGYISLVAKFKTEESVQSILVCEPSHLVAVKRNGEVKVWAMNSLWSEKIEEFILPSLDIMSSCLVELKKIPRHPLLIVGQNEFGDFVLWDISKRTILSRFSAPRNSIFQFLPVGLFGWKSGYASAHSVEEQIKGIMIATERWFSRNSDDGDFLSFEGDDMAVWLLVSAVHESEAQYDHQKNVVDLSTNGSWRLALLVNNMLIFGSALDPRASVVDKFDGLGIIGTHDGLVYIWNLATGLKLADLHHFKSGRISCMYTDSKSGVVAVAGDENQLLVYEILHA